MFDSIEYFTEFYFSKWQWIVNEKLYKISRILCYLLVLCINLVYLFYDKKVVVNNVAYSIIDKPRNSREVVFKQIIFALQFTFLICSNVSLIIWGFIYLPLISLKKWDQFFQLYKRKLLKKQDCTIEDERILSLLRKNVRDINTEERNAILLNYYRPPEPFMISVRLIYLAQVLKFWLEDTKFYILLIYVYFSYMGNAVHMIFFILNLLIEFYLDQENIIIMYKSLTDKLGQLGFTFLLMNIIIIIYAMFGFNMISNDFFFNLILPNGENQCMDAMQCYLTVFNLGARSAGCIGDVMNYISFDKQYRSLYYIRYIFDVSIFFIISLLFLNIFGVIVIENFSQIREEKKSRELENKNYCFICSLKKSYFDTISQDYEFHVNFLHNKWDYIFQAYSVKVKDFTEYNGFESYLKKNIDNESIDWFPFFQTRILIMNNEEEELKRKFTEINEKFDKIISLLLIKNNN